MERPDAVPVFRRFEYRRQHAVACGAFGPTGTTLIARNTAGRTADLTAVKAPWSAPSS
jgi:hypothetical protein